MKEHKHAEVLRAIADGKEVQFFNECWHTFNQDYHASPLSNPGEIRAWRVKPEPKPDYCFYAGYNNNYGCGSLFVSRDCITSSWDYKIKITIDGETNEPKSVKLIK